MAFEPFLFHRLRSAGVRVICADSGGVANTIEDMSAAVWFQLDTLEEQERAEGRLPARRYVLLGYSMGGFVVSVMASLRRHRVGGVVFLCTAAVDLEMLTTFSGEAGDSAKPPSPDKDSPENRSRPPHFPLPIDEVTEQIGACMAFAIASSVTPYVKTLTCPVLNIFCALDTVIPPHASRALRDVIPSANYTEFVLNEGNHHMTYARLDVLDAEILRWFQKAL